MNSSHVFILNSKRNIMSLTEIKNKLIMYKTYEKLPQHMVEEIQNCLLTKRKEEDFIELLRKAETLIN
jgi:hypothetical protein